MNILLNDNEIKLLKSRDLIPLLCDSCGKKFFRNKHQLLSRLKLGVKLFRCNRKCRTKTGTIVKCYTCNSNIYKTPAQLKKSNKHYCSSKCSCIQSNKIRWKNHIPEINTTPIKCDKCGCIRSYQTKNCPACRREKININHKNTTIKQLKTKYKLRNNSSYWYSSEIRQLNRKWNKSLLELPCQVCGYKIHVELCHIKPISQFSENSKLETVNDEKNNLVLCPNHHYEFDNEIIKLENIKLRDASQDRTDIIQLR